jgi:hypothetical protein
MQKRKEMVPILEDFKSWLYKRALQVPPSTLLRKAEVNHPIVESDPYKQTEQDKESELK